MCAMRRAQEGGGWSFFIQRGTRSGRVVVGLRPGLAVVTQPASDARRRASVPTTRARRVACRVCWSAPIRKHRVQASVALRDFSEPLRCLSVLACAAGPTLRVAGALVRHRVNRGRVEWRRFRADHLGAEYRCSQSSITRARGSAGLKDRIGEALGAAAAGSSCRPRRRGRSSRLRPGGRPMGRRGRPLGGLNFAGAAVCVRCRSDSPLLRGRCKRAFYAYAIARFAAATSYADRWDRADLIRH